MVGVRVKVRFNVRVIFRVVFICVVFFMLYFLCCIFPHCVYILNSELTADQIPQRIYSLWHVQIILRLNSLMVRTESHGSSQVKDRSPLLSKKLYHNVKLVYTIKQAFRLTHNY